MLAFGSRVPAALEAGALLDATVVNMRFVKPLDEAMILHLAHSHHLLVTIEENVLAGGAGSAVSELLNRNGCDTPILNLGLPDCFPAHGDTARLLAEAGLERDGIVAAVQQKYALPASAAVAATAALASQSARSESTY